MLYSKGWKIKLAMIPAHVHFEFLCHMCSKVRLVLFSLTLLPRRHLTAGLSPAGVSGITPGLGPEYWPSVDQTVSLHWWAIMSQLWKGSWLGFSQSI